jgi:hypothetical protein
MAFAIDPSAGGFNPVGVPLSRSPFPNYGIVPPPPRLGPGIGPPNIYAPRPPFIHPMHIAAAHVAMQAAARAALRARGF